MVPRSKSKRLTKQLTKAGVKSSVANTTTEESFVNNFQMASTSSPSNGGLHEIRYFSSVSNIVARGMYRKHSNIFYKYSRTSVIRHLWDRMGDELVSK